MLWYSSMTIRLKGTFLRRELPASRFPRFPLTNPAKCRDYFSRGLFRSCPIHGSDLQRAEQYKDNAKRFELLAHSRNLKGYLKDPGYADGRPPSFVPGHVPRITQLINKSNQLT